MQESSVGIPMLGIGEWIYLTSYVPLRPRDHSRGARSFAHRDLSTDIGKTGIDNTK